MRFQGLKAFHLQIDFYCMNTRKASPKKEFNFVTPTPKIWTVFQPKIDGPGGANSG